MTWGSWYWPAFLLSTLAALLGPETYALVSDWRNTLSAWSWLDEPGIYSWKWILSLLAWAAFVIWITGHIWWKKWG